VQEKSLIKPIRFRFTDPEDVARWGDRWYVYDEGAIVRTPARELVALEQELGMTVISAMNGFRDDSVLGNLAATWLAVRAVDPELAGPFDDFTPLIMLINYESIPDEVDEGKDEGTPLPLDWTSNGPPSDPPPTVVLQTLPVAE
jgi:hypothetical protein